MLFLKKLNTKQNIFYFKKPSIQKSYTKPMALISLLKYKPLQIFNN
jgi:hypothetical protein